ncbi:unnamed protein product [Lactuca virosa]|uniref:Thiolase N-terminal domain-containing protein n=1 Tax=Lactuca virosa TaxID=75947 RepID=A0AAU9LAQ8_9ASTR|nr:unnamed protein product [Lactuca virosa]
MVLAELQVTPYGISCYYFQDASFGNLLSLFPYFYHLYSAYRSPLCKRNRRGVKNAYPDDILAPVLKALIEKTNINPAEVGDTVVGSVFGPGSQRMHDGFFLCRLS